MAICKRRGFIWPSFELYGGVAGMFDYGPLGCTMKNNILEVWRDIYKGREGFVEIDSETVNPAEVFKASGHVDEFSDYMTYCTQCQLPFRADHLVKNFCENPDTMSPAELEGAFSEFGIKCPECGGDLGKVEEFNLMFKTTIGPGSARVGYLRPETAQGIFVNFQNLYRYNREKLPLGVIQTGRGYRNEISPRQGMIRMREFNMMEVELFVDPHDKGWSRFPEVEDEELVLVPNTGTDTVVKTVGQAVEEGIIANRVLAYFVCTTKQLLLRLGIDADRLRFRQHLKDEMAHYAADCWDAEVLLPSSRVYPAKELRESDSVQLGFRDQWLTMTVGNFTIQWKSFDGRFPKVENIIPQTAAITSWLELDAQDAAFVTKRIDDMPGEKDQHRPVTLELNGHVALRSADKTGDNAAELLLANSRYTGTEVRVTMTRDFLKHALSMGLNRIGFDTHERPMLAVDGNRRYVWMPLTSDPILRTEATTIVSSAEVRSQMPVKTRLKPILPTTQERVPVLATATKTVKPNAVSTEDRSPLDEAEALRETLRNSLGQVNTLVRSLKHQLRQNRMLRSTLASLKRLQSLEA